MVITAAKLANAHEFIILMPNAYKTVVGDAGMKLSGGQRQRIAIARAMLRKPEIMVLDEATSSLDNIAEKKVQEAINNISQYTTVVVIAHRLSTIQNADKILVLDNGKIVEQGRHEALLNKKGKYFNVIIKAKQKQSLRAIKDLRITLIKEGVELESYLSDFGSAVFEHVLLGKYSLEVSSIKGRLATVVLDIKA